MADNSFRNQRRDVLGRGGASAQRDRISDDPLAELARLIGQSDPQSPHGRLPAPPPTAVNDIAFPTLDWSALSEDHGQQGPDVQQHYPASQPPAYPPYPAVEASRRHDAGGDDQPAVRPYSPPAALFDDALAAARLQSDGYDGKIGSAVTHAPPLPYIPPAPGGGASDEEGQYQAHGSYEDGEAADEYQADAAAARRRGAVAIVAVLGLVVLGTAGALGYHAMFGGSMIPSLPPIIKPGDTPVKIVPKKTAPAGSSTQADADTKAGGDQLVSREEKPVAVHPVDSMPRVVTTIPVMSNPAEESTLPGTPPPTGAPQAFSVPAGSAGQGGSPAASPAMGVRSAPVPFDQFSGSASAPPPASKPVHTVLIKPAQSRPADRPASAPTSARAERVRPHPSRTAREPRSRMASAAPLSIVPTQAGGAAPPPARTHTAMAHAYASASSAPESLGARQGGATQGMSRGYAVQVSSQRSEAEARAAFRALQAKFPQQLGRRQGWVRRANLGAKGVHYRVLVGPFASAEEASSVCGSLKAAGASCLVQRN